MITRFSFSQRSQIQFLARIPWLSDPVLDSNALAACNIQIVFNHKSNESAMTNASVRDSLVIKVLMDVPSMAVFLAYCVR